MKFKKIGGHILYLATNCATASARDTFVSALSQYVDIDSIGGCIHNHEFPSTLHSLEYDDIETKSSKRLSWKGYSEPANALASRYQFRLVIPNSLCTDYVTEKFFESLANGVIPIYIGSPNSSHDWDPGISAGVHPAVIHVIDFSSIEALAEHILHVTLNETLYQSYFEYLNTPDSVHYPRHLHRLLQQGGRITEGGEFINSFQEFACLKLLQARQARRANAGQPVHMNTAKITPSCFGNWTNVVRQQHKRVYGGIMTNGDFEKKWLKGPDKPWLWLHRILKQYS
jgi:hypothetical protein